MVSLLRLPAFTLGDLAFESPPPDARRLAMVSKRQKNVSSGPKSLHAQYEAQMKQETRSMMCPILRKSCVKLPSSQKMHDEASKILHLIPPITTNMVT